VLWTRLQLADPGAAIVVYLFASAITVRTTIHPLPPQIIDNETALPAPPGHVRCCCSPIDHPPLEMMALLARRGRDCRPSSPQNAGLDVSSNSLIGQFFLLNQIFQPTSPAMTNP
jgi:hypothetical protein